VIAEPGFFVQQKSNLTSAIQGAYNSGKHGNLGEILNSGKIRELEIYSGNFCISGDAI